MNFINCDAANRDDQYGIRARALHDLLTTEVARRAAVATMPVVAALEVYEGDDIESNAFKFQKLVAHAVRDYNSPGDVDHWSVARVLISAKSNATALTVQDLIDFLKDAHDENVSGVDDPTGGNYYTIDTIAIDYQPKRVVLFTSIL